jgi:hypothetical protein
MLPFAPYQALRDQRLSGKGAAVAAVTSSLRRLGRYRGAARRAAAAAAKASAEQQKHVRTKGGEEDADQRK